MNPNQSGNAGACSPSNGSNGFGQPVPDLYVDCLDLAVGHREINVHTNGIYIFKTPGMYDVTLRQQQLPPTAVWPPQQAQMLQQAPLGNGFGFNGPPTFAQQQPNGGIAQPAFGGFGVAQCQPAAAPGGNTGMIPIPEIGQRSHLQSPLPPILSPAASVFGPPRNYPDSGYLSGESSDTDTSTMSPVSPQ